MNDKLGVAYKIVCGLFILESCLLLAGLKLNLLTYGVDLQSSLMAVGISFGLILSVILVISLKRMNSNLKRAIAILTGLLMVLTGVLYLLDDHLRFSL